jgi:hypothetical protein
MKKFTFFLVLMFVTSLVFAQAQVQTIHNPNARVTVTNDQIKAWGEASQQNGSRSIVLDFEGLGNGDAILQFYNGGTSGLGFSGTNYGIYFGAAALSLIDSDAGGGGNFANEPSPNTVMFFTSGNAIMNVPAGFTTGFSFYYTSSAAGTVFVYDGLDATGTLLASQPFTANYNLNCTGDPNGAFCHWDAVGVAFSGTAKSVEFSGVADQCAFDDVTFGSITPGPSDVPISDWALFIGIGLILIAAVIRFRRLI